MSYNISSLIVDLLSNALWGHPPNGNLLLILSFTLVMTKVVSDVHVLRHSKVSYLDHSMLVNPITDSLYLAQFGMLQNVIRNVNIIIYFYILTCNS